MRKRKIDGQIVLGIILSAAAITFAALMPKPNRQIAVAGEDGNGNHYVYVNVYALKAKYDGQYFIDSTGNTWATDGVYTKGKMYTLEMSDNGTDGILDDVILSVR